MPNKDELTLTQAAAETGLSPHTLKSAIRAGTLYAEKVGERLWLIPRASLEHWQANRPRRGRPARQTGDSHQS